MISVMGFKKETDPSWGDTNSQEIVNSKNRNPKTVRTPTLYKAKTHTNNSSRLGRHEFTNMFEDPPPIIDLQYIIDDIRITDLSNVIYQYNMNGLNPVTHNLRIYLR